MKETIKRMYKANPPMFITVTIVTSVMIFLFCCMAIVPIADKSPKHHILIEGVKQGLPNDSILHNYEMQHGY